MPTSVLIFGDRLYSGGWKEIRTRKPRLFGNITVSSNPAIPDRHFAKGTAYIDLEDPQFCSPDFLRKLMESFDRLRIVGIADSTSEDKTFEFASWGVSEILTRDEYESRIAAFLDEPKSPSERVIRPANRYDVCSIIGGSPQMQEIKRTVDLLRKVDYPNAILLGETGTGKDLLAKVLHYTGLRKDNQFIEVNCSAIPDQLFESELFGHKKGAFTDAGADKTGLFEFADNGTIFLDEVGNLSPSAQAKLLKILETKKLRPLGRVEERDINVRVLAATNINLEDAVGRGSFREDLLFRLNLIAIRLPPLRSHPQDIPELAGYNFDFYCTIYNKRSLTITEEAIQRLMEHDWPGNVRELRNVIERTVLLATDMEISSLQIDKAICNGRISASERRQIVIEVPEQGISLRAIEKRAVGEILNMVNWNRSEAARILGISRARLRRIMEESKLERNRRD